MLKRVDIKEKNIPLTPTNRCQECEGSDFVHDDQVHEIICLGCGIVQPEREMNRGPEWRVFDQEQMEQRARTGSPQRFTLPDKGLCTMIGWTNYDARGRKLPASSRDKIKRLMTWQRRLRASGALERKVAAAITEIGFISDQLSLAQPFREEAVRIYRKTVKTGFGRGWPRRDVAAVCLYVACRIRGQPITFREIAKAGQLKHKRIARLYRALFWELDDLQIPPIDNLVYLERIAQKTDISWESKKLAIELFYQAKSSRQTNGMGIAGTVAAIVYFACQQTGEEKTQTEIAEAASVTTVTVRNRLKQLFPVNKELEPSPRLRGEEEIVLLSPSFFI